MSLSIGGGVTNVTATGTFSQTKATAAVAATAFITAATTTTIGTVPANKVWRILSVQITAYCNEDASAEQYCKVILNSVDAVMLCVAGKAADCGTGSTAVTWNYGACPVLTAGQTATFTTGTNRKAAASISYVEEAA